jgi:hypothetical protein
VECHAPGLERKLEGVVVAENGSALNYLIFRMYLVGKLGTSRLVEIPCQLLDACSRDYIKALKPKYIIDFFSNIWSPQFAIY